MDHRPWMLQNDGLAIRVRVTPKAGRDALEGIERLADGRAMLKVRLRAAPVDGCANSALERLIANALGVPLSRVAVSAGAASRRKRVSVTGNATVLAAKLEALLVAIGGAPRTASGTERWT